MFAQAIRRPLELKGNNRGAIMVLGIFFACMMIGWMWMMIGLGDAIVWRDRSQEAADSMAYSSAAIQAQGMNLISFVNVLMLILTAVYLVMSFVYDILDFLHVMIGSTNDGSCLPTSCDVRKDDLEILSMVPYLEWLQPIADVWCDVGQFVGALHDGNTNDGAPGGFGGVFGKYEKVMIRVMPPLSTFEDFVSYATPWAGELVGIYMATQYNDWGKMRMGLPISATLIPATLTPGQAGNGLPAKKYRSCNEEEKEQDGECTKPQDCDAQNPSNCEPYDGGDKREGLPVGIPDNGFTAVCDYAGAKLGDVAKEAMVGMLGKGIGGAIGTVVQVVIEAMGTKFTDSYCKQSSTGMLTGSLIGPDKIFRMLTAAESGGWKNKEHCPNDEKDGGWTENRSGCGGPGSCGHVYDMKLGDGNQFWQDPRFAGGPHLVVDYASNGNDWMQVWGGVWGGNRVEQSEKLVGVAGMDSNGSGTWNKIIPQNSESLFSFYMSQAEFYYDCEEKWYKPECNKDGNASYNMNWRARMRRMHGVSWGQDLLGYVWGGSIGAAFDDRAKKIIGGIVGGAFSDPLKGALATTAANDGYTALKNWAGDQVGSMYQPSSAIPDWIH